MRANRKTLFSLLATAMMSAVAIGNAYADPNDLIGDLTGDKPLSPRQQRNFNEKALQDAAGNRLLILPVEGSYNGEERLTAHQQHIANARIKSSSDARALPVLQFQGDWNGTAKAGFPHR
ncbi:hypothetical protein [Roseibium marinum]|uniref:Uncharacterized protein n=1 Tax=Roseibium marinum TaxID=281252 RepID=A0A2S3V120_9HYPH|nr:hypothetical protein [Roseibium marinum]POF33672.1 hypothetical protein CLV41_101121 [Roseibium marinum]